MNIKLQTKPPILGKHLAVLWTALGILVIYARPATANTIDTANATVSCSGYSLSVMASSLDPNTQYSISYEIDITPGSAGFPITGSIPIPLGSTSFNGTATGSFALTGSFTFSGTATLVNATPPSSIPITFSPTTSLTCPPPSLCTAQSTNSANFNGTPIQVGDFIWFNANFKAQGIPGTGATLSLTNLTISLMADQPYTFQVPNAQITFSPSASCATTTFDSTSNTWMTTVPLSGTDDIFLTGLAIPVPPGFAKVNGKVSGPVVWTGTFGTTIPGVNIQWKWGTAVYACSDSGYNQFAPKASHQNACNQNNGDQAGTPEDPKEKQCVVGGGTGGGGSNWTGSWSGTVSVSPVCK